MQVNKSFQTDFQHALEKSLSLVSDGGHVVECLGFRLNDHTAAWAHAKNDPIRVPFRSRKDF